jgi:hypothetical protein
MFSLVTPIAGKQQTGYLNIIDTVQKDQLGTVVEAVDPYFGFAEFIYVQFPASAAITIGQVVGMSGVGPLAFSAAVLPNTANTGRLLAVASNAVASNPAIQYGWVQLSGHAVLKAVASVAALAAIGIDATTGGSVNANSAGRQILPGMSVAPSTTTVVKQANTTNGSPIIRVSDAAGWVPGLAITGTGVSGTILSIDADNRSVTLSANATGTASTAVTATYTGFIIAQICRSTVQGAIT